MIRYFRIPNTKTSMFMTKLMTLLMCFCLAVGQLTAQTPASRTVKGKVTDDKGAGIANASVIAKGSTRGTTTATDGSFSLVVPTGTKSLVVSSLNFTTLDFAIGNKETAITISLQSSTNSLDEVVVVGYGTQKKTDLTASVGKVSGDKVAD